MQYRKRQGSSRFKGVYWDKCSSRWVVRLCIDKKPVYIGKYLDEIVAAKAYDRKARQVYGENAITNFE